MKPFLLIVCGLVLLVGTPVLPTLPAVPSWRLPVPVVAPVAATAAVYVYEKNETPVPTGVTVGLDRLNRERKIVATLCEVDTTDGTGDVPDQYRLAVEAARKASLPSLVVLAGAAVVRVVAAPKTAEDVMRAVP